MTAYVVFVRDEMKDQAAYDQYLQLGVPTLAPFGGEILVANGVHEAFEGADFDGSVVLRFPDMASARAWYNSPGYAKVKSMRLDATVGRAILLEGVA
ncbi:DUF1330 domain-containing protein [Wielerella bovis]|uniref:DUF1330 domain-containing protein n=1 Tax=Wielerella bovis TaxID=2917790 RepID=UPI0020194F42|nr:DUF1330 domain-containing protein [Wielerella bovis]MCG7656345.1 DUF1330 domain-containing protein [Wielerella bovis]MCG7658570.1 DUF1330 domain-containing protein [Wielerella bovis]